MSSALSIRSSVDGNGRRSARPQNAFTFLELIVVVAVFFAVLALVALPALARSKTRSPAVGCLSNLRQLMTAWQMYADENRGVFMPNGPLGGPSSSMWAGASSEGWGNFADNTNASVLRGSYMGRYANSNALLFRCPGDVVPSANGFRVRSYSMNSQVATVGVNYAAPLKTYVKESDITCPTPAGLFVLCDEHPCSLDDGSLQVNTAPNFPNVPASYLEGGCGFSYADGHADVHKWSSKLLIPVRYAVVLTGVAASTSDPDWRFLISHAGCTN